MVVTTLNRKRCKQFFWIIKTLHYFDYFRWPHLACVAGGIVGFRAHKQKRRSRDSERRSREWLGEEKLQRVAQPRVAWGGAPWQLLRPKPLAAAPLVCRGFAARCRGFATCLCTLNPTIPPAMQASPTRFQ